jgi:MoxR-like ATPase
VSVPELGTLRAYHIPFVVLTSNNSREMSDALKRRCLHLHLDFPDAQRELEIVRLKVPGAGEKLAQEAVRFLQRLRKLDLKKKPSVSETLDWVRALTLLHIQGLDDQLVNETLVTLVKYEEDIRRTEDEIKQYLVERKAQHLSSPDNDKDFLH